MVTNYKEISSLALERTGPAIEALAAIVVVVLSIIGLAVPESGIITSIGVVVLGASLLVYTATINTEYWKIVAGPPKRLAGTAELSGSMAMEILADGGAIVLGILGIIGFNDQVLLPCAVVALGTGLILAASGLQLLNILKVQAARTSEAGQEISQSPAFGTVAAQIFAGGAAIVVGILAITTTHAAVLTLVALLILGVSVAFGGLSLAGRLFELFGNEPASSDP